MVETTNQVCIYRTCDFLSPPVSSLQFFPNHASSRCWPYRCDGGTCLWLCESWCHQFGGTSGCHHQNGNLKKTWQPEKGVCCKLLRQRVFFERHVWFVMIGQALDFFPVFPQGFFRDPSPDKMVLVLVVTITGKGDDIPKVWQDTQLSSKTQIDSLYNHCRFRSSSWGWYINIYIYIFTDFFLPSWHLPHMQLLWEGGDFSSQSARERENWSFH